MRIRKIAVKLAVIAGVLLAALLLALQVAAMAGASTGPIGQVACSANPCHVAMPNNGSAGLVITDSRGPLVDNPFLITDYQDAPMFWVNVGGAYSGDTELCVTGPDIFAPMRACLMPNGTLRLLGRHGSVTLTARDIRYLHHLENEGK